MTENTRREFLFATAGVGICAVTSFGQPRSIKKNRDGRMACFPLKDMPSASGAFIRPTALYIVLRHPAWYAPLANVMVLVPGDEDGEAKVLFQEFIPGKPIKTFSTAGFRSARIGALEESSFYGRHEH